MADTIKKVVKNNPKPLLILLGIVILGCIIFFSTNKQKSTNTSNFVSSEGITLDRTDLTLNTGSSNDWLIVTLSSPETGSKELEWMSSNPEVAHVVDETTMLEGASLEAAMSSLERKGNIIVGQAGTAIITVKTASGKVATANITVVDGGHKVTFLRLKYNKEAVYGGPGATDQTRFAHPELTVDPVNAENKDDIKFEVKHFCEDEKNLKVSDEGVVSSDVSTECSVSIIAYVEDIKSNEVRISSEKELVLNNSSDQIITVPSGDSRQHWFSVISTFSKGAQSSDCWDITEVDRPTMFPRIKGIKKTGAPGKLIVTTKAGQSKTFDVKIV